MIELGLREFRRRLLHHLQRAGARGEVIVLYRHDEPVAEVRPLVKSARSDGLRPFGVYAGQVHVTPRFFEPLPEDVLAPFVGRPASDDRHDEHS